MSLVIEQEQLPLRAEADGTIRVGETRVTLDSMVDAFCAGSTPEETVQQFPTVKLADVYLVFGFYLKHREEIETAYLAPRRARADALRREYELRNPSAKVRERLMTRRSERATTG